MSPMSRRVVGTLALASSLSAPSNSWAQPYAHVDETYAEPKQQPTTSPPDPAAFDSSGPKGPEEERRQGFPSWRGDTDSIEAVSFGVFGAGMAAYAGELDIGPGPGVHMPDVLADKNLHLHGAGWLAGAGARLGYQSDGGFRLALALGGFRLGGMELRHDQLPEGVSARLARADMFAAQVTTGVGFDARVVYPYLEGMLMFNVVTAKVDLTTTELGYVGTTPLAAFSFGVAPRVGVFIPIDGDFFLDISGHYGLFGIERGGGQVMFGIWDD